jgi:hypothetical protein
MCTTGFGKYYYIHNNRDRVRERGCDDTFVEISSTWPVGFFENSEE